MIADEHRCSVQVCRAEPSLRREVGGHKHTNTRVKRVGRCAGARMCAQLGCKARRTRASDHEEEAWRARRGWPVTVHGLESGPAGVEDKVDRWGPAGREKRNKGRDGLVERYRKVEG
jgi:hypothetical protein